MSDSAIELENVTKADAGSYVCSWEVEPSIPKCAADLVHFTLTVIGRHGSRVR